MCDKNDEIVQKFMNIMSISEIGIPEEMMGEIPDEEIIYDWNGDVLEESEEEKESP